MYLSYIIRYTLIQESFSCFYSVEWLIVDEADKLFEDGIRGFREQLDAITKACTSENLRRGMFSATNTPAVSKWCRRNMKGLVTVTIGQRYIVFS